MIKLDVAEYCHDCPDFEPEVSDKHIIYDDNGEYRRVLGNIYVVCEHYNTCHRFMTYLKSRLAKEKGDDNGRKV